MSRYDPRGLLDRTFDQMIAAALLFSAAVSMLLFLLYLVINFWPLFLCAGLGFGVGWFSKGRHSW